MPFWEVKVELRVSNAVAGNAVRNAMDDWFAGRTQVEQRVPPLRRAQRGSQVVISRTKFIFEVVAQEFYDRIETWWAGEHAARILAGSRLSMHRCAHDLPPEEQYPCMADPRAEYKELVKT